jgi:hypothetical protein
MKHKAVLTALIVFILFLTVILGVLVLKGCVTPAVAEYWILSFTLVAILLYVYYTHEMLRVHEREFQLGQNPVLASYIEQVLERKVDKDGKEVWKTIFHIQNRSRVHAVARININPNLADLPAFSNDAYSGKRWWYVPALKRITGNFPLTDILESANTSLQAFRDQKITLRLAIKVTYQRWGQKEDRPTLENPPDQHYYDHDKQIWVHEPTTSAIQFPMFSENDSVTVEQERRRARD